MGYAGGTTANPTYNDLGDHTETLQIDYDPERITYEQLLTVFWRSHSPTMPVWSRQYMSIVFAHSDAQQRLAESTRRHEAEASGRTIHTEIVPAGTFYLAEDYHQKYYLRGHRELLDEYRAIYPALGDLVDSTAVARVNGYVGGHGDRAQLEVELSRLGLSEAGQQRLLALTR